MQNELHSLPSKRQYVEALLTVLPRMSHPQLRMLRAHVQAPMATISADDLALAAGFVNWKPVNMHYGLLGTALRAALGHVGEIEGQKSYIFASFLPPDDVHLRWRWVLHTAVIDALHELAWFEEEYLGADPGESRKLAAVEGAQKRQLVVHRHREAALRLTKLIEARRAHPLKRLICAVPGCGFDFEATYGTIGIGYAEVHHLLPLAMVAEERLTTLDDLAVVCSNCHRMIHRGGQCRQLENLRLSHCAAGPNDQS